MAVFTHGSLGPSYYIYVKNVEVTYSGIKRFLLGKKGEVKEEVSIIKSWDWSKLDEEKRKLYRPLTIGDVERYGDQKMKNQADMAFVAKLTGLPI